MLAAASETPALFDRLAAEARRVGGGAVSEAGFDLARVRAGRPRFGRDFGAQQYPQEAGHKQRAVSFGKGCYLGQEVVCTLENRGRLTRRLVRLNRGRPTCCSSLAMPIDRVGWETPQRTAAREKLPSSITARK